MRSASPFLSASLITADLVVKVCSILGLLCSENKQTVLEMIMGYERELSSARQKALDLEKKKDTMEAEMDAIFSALTVSHH